MKKISLALLGCIVQMLSAHGQMSDSSSYKQRKLQLKEVNFVSSYYIQDGNNSAVTGGLGSEHLTDFANTLDVVLTKTDKKSRQYTWTAEIGIDNYSSASSDKIDPSTVSSASSKDTRIYPSVAVSRKDTKGNTFGLVGSYSTEFDYKSTGLGINYTRTSKDNNRELSIHLQSYMDQWTVILPIELRGVGGKTQGTEPRNSYSGSLSFSQVINKRFQLALLMDVIYQSGLLATDYQRVYFDDLSHRIERLPETRLKIPIGLRANYFLDDRFIFRVYYRYYNDDWHIQAHTASLEVPIKLNANVSLSPFYRFYAQSAATYFAPYGAHQTSDGFYTSDYDLSAFTSQFMGTGVRFSPEKGMFRIKHWSALELRYGLYLRSNGLSSNIVSLHATFK